MLESIEEVNTDGLIIVTLSYTNSRELQLHYQVQNISAMPMYLCNRLYRDIDYNAETGRLLFEVKQNLVNIQLADNEVVVSKKVIDVPKWILVEALQIPCLSKIIPGEKLEETIILDLPLIPYTIYEGYSSRGAINFQNLFFELGYFIASPIVESFISTVDTTEGPVFYTDPFPASDQSLFKVGPFKLPVEVINPK